MLQGLQGQQYCVAAVRLNGEAADEGGPNHNPKTSNTIINTNDDDTPSREAMMNDRARWNKRSSRTRRKEEIKQGIKR